MNTLEKITNEIKKTIKDFIINIISRIESIYEQNDIETGTNDSRLIFLLEDIASLADGIGILIKENPLLDLTELNEKLNMLNIALEEKDSALIKDILMYELRPLLEYWNENI